MLSFSKSTITALLTLVLFLLLTLNINTQAGVFLNKIGILFNAWCTHIYTRIVVSEKKSSDLTFEIFRIECLLSFFCIWVFHTANKLPNCFCFKRNFSNAIHIPFNFISLRFHMVTDRVGTSHEFITEKKLRSFDSGVFS